MYMYTFSQQSSKEIGKYIVATTSLNQSESPAINTTAMSRNILPRPEANLSKIVAIRPTVTLQLKQNLPQVFSNFLLKIRPNMFQPFVPDTIIEVIVKSHRKL